MVIPINFAINSYQARSGLLSSERVVNMYAELTPAQSLFKVALFGTPGLKVWSTLGIFNPVYAIERMNDNIFVVCGLNVYRIDTNKNLVLIGTMSTSPGRVMTTNNGTQVTILTESGVAYYCTTTPGSLAQITSGNYNLSNSVTTQDGYTIFTNIESRQFQISALNDTSTYAALDFASVEVNGDDLVRGISNNLETWFFKESVTEVYYNSGNATFPFERKNGVLIQKGCAAKYSVAIFDNSFYFLGNDRNIYSTNGYQLQQLTPPPVTAAIESYSRVDDAFGFVYAQDGHKFYCITFPSGNATWCYDITTGLWHERESLNPITLQPQEWRANCFNFFAGKNLVGDGNSGIIYELDLGTYDENGTPLIATAVSATQFDNYNRSSVSDFVLMMDTGVGINSGQGSDPQIMLQVSTDGGKTLSNEMWQPLGVQGAYETEVFWSNIGYGRSLIAQIKIADPVKRSVIGAYLSGLGGQV